MTYEEPIVPVGPWTSWAFLLTVGVLLVLAVVGRQLRPGTTDVLFAVAGVGSFVTVVLLALGAP